MNFNTLWPSSNIKLTLLCLLLLSSILFSQSAPLELKLEYGILHRNPENESLTVLDSGAVVVDSDELRINVQYSPSASCYIIYEDPTQNILMLFNSNSGKPEGKDTNFHTTGWLSFSPPIGSETIYLILSKLPLDMIEKLVEDLENSSGGRAKKFYRRFASEIDKLISPEKKHAVLAARLDKPIVGGVSFRGDDEDKINAFSMTHEAKGSEVIIKKITLDHQ